MTLLRTLRAAPAAALAAALLLAGASTLPATAQDASTGATTPGTATQAPAADGGLSMGKPVASVTGATLPTKDQAQPGQTYLADTFGDWEQRCKKTPKGNDPCEMFQLLKDSTGNPTAEFSIFAVPKGQNAAAGATLVAPLGTMLTRGVGVAIKGAPNKKVYPFLFCAHEGCVSRFGFTADEVAALKKGTTASVVIYPVQAPGKPVELQASLKGFTAGLDALEKAQAQQTQP